MYYRACVLNCFLSYNDKVCEARDTGMAAKTDAVLFPGAVVVFILLVKSRPSDAKQYIVDDSVGVERRFDGIGGLSGGGVKPVNFLFTCFDIIIQNCADHQF